MGTVSRRVPRAGRDRNALGCRCHGHYGSRRDAAHCARDGAAAPHSPGARGDRRDDPHGGAVHLRCAARAARGAAVRLQDARRVSRRGCRQPAGVQPQRRHRLRPLRRKGRCDRAGVSRGDRRCRAAARALRSRHRLGTGDRLPQGARRGFAPEAHRRLPGVCHRRRDRQRHLPRRMRCGGRARLRRCRRRYSGGNE